MFPSDKLLGFAVIVVTQLTNTSPRNTKPDVIRLVYALDPFTILGVCLDYDFIITFSHDTSNVCKFLTLKVLAYVTLQGCTCDVDVDSFPGHFICSKCKELENFS